MSDVAGKSSRHIKHADRNENVKLGQQFRDAFDMILTCKGY